MKKSELRELIREQVRNLIKEANISQEAHIIHVITRCGQDAAQNFIDDNKLDGKKLAAYVRQHSNSKEKYDVRDIIAGTGVGANKSFRARFLKQFKESVIKEATTETADTMLKFIQSNISHFAAFLKPKSININKQGNVLIISPASKSFTVTVDFDKQTIDSTGKPKWPESTSYVELMEYIKVKTNFKVLNESVVKEDILNAPGQDQWDTKFHILYDDLPANLDLKTASLNKLFQGIPYQHVAWPELSDDGAFLFKTAQDLAKAKQALGMNESVVTEANELSSYKIGDNVKFSNGEIWKVTKPGVKGDKIFLAPFNAIAKKGHISLAIEFTADELKDTVTESINEFGPLAGSGNSRANDLENIKREASRKSERGETVYVVGSKYGSYKLSKYFEKGNTYAAFYNGMPQVVEGKLVNEANSNNEVEMILSKDQDFDDVKRLLITDKKANNLNFTHWSHGQPLGSIRGNLITMYFYNTKDEVTSFIQRNDIKIANKSNFNLDELKDTVRESINEDAGMVVDVAMGVAVGLMGLWALVQSAPLVGRVFGDAAEYLASKAEKKAKAALKNQRKETIAPIIAKFKSDDRLKQMYQELPPYTNRTANARKRQLTTIGNYIKSKLTPDEMAYFRDISAMLRDGDIKESVIKEEITLNSPSFKKLVAKVQEISDKSGNDWDELKKYLENKYAFFETYSRGTNPAAYVVNFFSITKGKDAYVKKKPQDYVEIGEWYIRPW